MCGILHTICQMQTVLAGDNKTWWRHQMEIFSAFTGLLCGEFTGLWWIPHTKASNAEPWCFLCPNKRLSKQSWGWLFETPLRSLWRNCSEHLAISLHFPTLRSQNSLLIQPSYGRPWFNTKISYHYRISHCGDKTVGGSSEFSIQARWHI